MVAIFIAALEALAEVIVVVAPVDVIAAIAIVCIPVGIRVLIVELPTVVAICLAGVEPFLVAVRHRLPECLRAVFVYFVVAAAALVPIDRRRIEIGVALVVESVIAQMDLLLPHAL